SSFADLLQELVAIDVVAGFVDNAGGGRGKGFEPGGASAGRERRDLQETAHLIMLLQQGGDFFPQPRVAAASLVQERIARWRRQLQRLEKQFARARARISLGAW